MIPQSFKDILSNGATWSQLVSLLIFLGFFIALVVYVMRKPKKYYKEEEEAPLNDGEEHPQY